MSKMLQQLSRLDKTALAELLENIYDLDDAVDKYIDLALAMADGDMKKQLIKQIGTIKRGRKFIDYSASFAFAKQLDSLLHGINELIRQQQYNEAFEVADKFIATAASVFERMDDSSGSVSDIYREAVGLWVQAATEVRRQAARSDDWVARVLGYFNNNDHGIYDTLLPQAGSLLTETELRQQAWHFESDAKQALKQSPKSESGYNFEAAHACIGLSSVAQALRDIELYERATLITEVV